MSGRHCQRCKSYWHLHGPRGECVQEPGVEASISRWEEHTIENALKAMRFQIVDYLRARMLDWTEEDAKRAEGDTKCCECDWPPAVGDVITRYTCDVCDAIVYMSPENS